MLVIQVLPAVPVESAGRSQLGLLDDGQLTVVGYGFDVPQTPLLVRVTEVVPQSGVLIE